MKTNPLLARIDYDYRMLTMLPDIGGYRDLLRDMRSLGWDFWQSADLGEARRIASHVRCLLWDIESLW